MDPLFEIQTCASLLADWRARSCDSALMPEEEARVRAIASPFRRDQFLAGRWLARTLLAQAQGGLCADWRISADVHSKPRVIGSELQLSIAHSGPFVACCVADRAVGVDVERWDRVRPIADMAALVCSVAELSELGALHGDEFSKQFFRRWSCKEARLKQRGLPFDVQTLRALQMEPATGVEAQVVTWFLELHCAVVSIAVHGASRVRARWPADWAAGPMLGARYVE